jgi:hypothetical protein
MSNEVKLSKNDIETLNAIYPINQSLKIMAGNPELRAFNATRTCAVVAKLDNAIPREFCIYDLREFLQVVGLFESPVLDFTDPKHVTVKSADGRQKLRYIDAAASLINSYFERNIELKTIDVVVEVTGAQLSNVMKAATTLKLEFVGFKSVDGKIVMTAFDKNNGDGNETNGFSVELGETTRDFNLFYKTEALSMLAGNCKFELSSSCVSRIENAGRVYFITMSKDSTFA